ncbi:MAG TPA: VWA domain-containing protein, partial [Pyrinomonadaceae bacterium]|nr:VWA domain-containing protein [Pyrinomonadaceae bacterium]
MTNSTLMGNHFLKVAFHFRPFALVWLSVVFLVASASAQNPPPRPSPEPEDIVRVFSELVQTDVTVFDKQGKFVNGLKPEDFELRIDGKTRPVEFFERIAAGSRDEDAQLSAARGMPDGGRRTTANAAAPLDRGRTIFFFVDDLHLSASNLLQMRKLLTRYVEENLSQNDIAAVASASGTIGFLQQLTDNKAVLRAAIERLQVRNTAFSDMQRPPMSAYHALLIDRQEPDVTNYFVDELLKENDRLPRDLAEEQVRSRAHQILQYAASTNTNTLAGLESLVRTSGTLPGRKLLIFISDGFFLDDRNSDSRERLRKITSAAAKSGVVIYSMDARGLVATLDDASSPAPFDPTGRLSRGASGELIASQDAMNALARDTGGRPIFNTNALDVGLTTAIRETSLYYMLAWRPEPNTTGDKYRKISVNLVGHPDWNVRVRQGFYDREAPTVRRNRKAEPGVTASSEPAVSETLLQDSFREVFQNSSDIPVTTSLGFLDMPAKGMMLTVVMMVNVESLHFVQEGNLLKASVDIRGTVYNDHGNAGSTFTDRLTVSASSPEQLEHSNKELIYTYQV